MTTIAPPLPRRVLIVDDNEYVGRITAAHAKAAGADARVTRTVAEFIDEFEAWSPEVAVVDLMLGDEDGLDVLRILAERKSEVRIIIASGVSRRVIDAATRYAQAQGLTVAGVLVKPYRRSELASLVTRGAEKRGRESSTARDAPPSATSGSLRDELNVALDNQDITLALQPKISCGNASLVGFEALARWTHPDAGPISAQVFVAEAERIGRVRDISDAILTAGLAWLADTYPTGPHLALNVSAMELTDATLVGRLVRACGRHAIPHSRIVIEVTESGTAIDDIVALETLTHVRLSGFSLSIDDFGTGYSSMAQVARMPFSELKVDRTFVSRMMTDAESRVIVNSTIDMAKALGLTVTAEGVDDPLAFEALGIAGCDYVQGFLVAPPMTPAAAAAWKPPALDDIIPGSGAAATA